MSRTTRGKYVITITDINTNAVDIKYGLTSDKSYTADKTKISELSGTCQPKKTMVFFGPSKQLHKCNVSIIDHESGRNVASCNCNYHCFWCKHSFNNISIGCPVSHTPRKIQKEYTSIINNNVYSMEEDSHLYGDSTYMTDGIFCSYNCCVAYIDDNITNPLYSNSKILLIRMYNEMFNQNVPNITPAPHWRTLTVFGGHMTISEFRDSFDKTEYQSHGITRNFNMNSIGTLFEKKLKF